MASGFWKKSKVIICLVDTLGMLSARQFLVSLLWKRSVCYIPYCMFGDGRVICFVKSECGMGTAKW